MLRNLQELYQYRALVWSLTVRELRARYRASVLGFLWTFLNPTLHMLVYVLLFEVVMKQQIPHYTYFIFIGLLPWIFFSSSVLGGATSISDRRDLLTKVRFPAQVLPATVVLTNLVNYLLSLPLMIALGAAFRVWPTWHSVAFPLVLAIQVLFTVALAYLLSALNVRFRDIQNVVNHLMMLWFFVTPVLYTREAIPAHYRQLLILGNPMALVITSYQDIFYAHRLPSLKPLLAITFLAIVLFWLSAQIFEARREQFAENV